MWHILSGDENLMFSITAVDCNVKSIDIYKQKLIEYHYVVFRKGECMNI